MSPRIYVIVPAIERFHRHYMPEPNSGCWLWTAAMSHGRTMFNVSPDRVNTQAARFIWSHLNGPIPDGHYICHHCDTPECVNPDHLFLGTPKDNMQDMIRKGRQNYAGAGRTRTERRALRTHCDNGHEFTPENRVPGTMRCLTCRRDSTRRAVAKNYAKRHADRNARRELENVIRAIELPPLPNNVRELRPLTPWPDEASA